MATRRRAVGRIQPDDPVLADPKLFGKGRFSHADWCGAFRNAVACNLTNCEIEGELPKDLHGTLFRNGPGRFERSGIAYRHFLDGDGFISAWQLCDGRASYRGDFVRTPDYQAEEAASSILFRGAFGTAKPGGPLANALDIRMKNLANTNVLAWGGKLLALYEAAHPCCLESDLAFAGTDDLQGLLSPGMAASSGVELVDGLLGMGGSAFTAHPKMDPHRNLLVGFRWASRSGGVELCINEWDELFEPIPELPKDGVQVFLPECDAQPHDFGLTDTHYVFIENRLRMNDTTNFLLGMKGAVECLETLPDLPQRIHVVPRPRRAGSVQHQAVVVIEGNTSAFDVHVAHCHDGPPLSWKDDHPYREDDLLTVYTSGWDQLPEGSFLGSWGADGKVWPFEVPEDAPAADFNEVPRARLLRHVLDVREGRVVERGVTPGCEALCMEHPTINCSYTGDPRCRFVYMVIGNECGLSTPPCGWARADLQTGEVKRWYAGSRSVTEEPHFVPRNGPQGTWTPGAPVGGEDDGWLLGVLFDAVSSRSCLCVLDAARIEDGPVCRVWLPHAVPHGLHGCFVPSEAV